MTWANREVLSGLKASVGATARPLQLLAHILSAEQLWLERLLQQPQTLPVWPESSFDQCEAQISHLSQRWQEFFEKLSPQKLAGERGLQEQQR